MGSIENLAFPRESVSSLPSSDEYSVTIIPHAFAVLCLPAWSSGYRRKERRNLPTICEPIPSFPVSALRVFYHTSQSPPCEDPNAIHDSSPYPSLPCVLSRDLSREPV